MTRKRCRRRVVRAVPPPGLRGQFSRGDLVELSLHQHTSIEAIRRGQATGTELWGYLRRVLMWKRAAELSGLGEPEMAAQMDMLLRVVERFERTARVGFSGTDYQEACAGADYVDQLAASVDVALARDAAIWADAQVAAIIKLSKQGHA